jgi:hypothetical protein
VVTANDRVEGTVLNVAVTAVFAFNVTSQVPVPEQPPPLQPAKVDPNAAEAVNVTTVPPGKFAMHVALQSMPAGFEVTVPVPVPSFVTLTCAVTGLGLKVAVTAVSPHRRTVQSAVPVQPPPLHPTKYDPPCGTPDRVTLVFQG